MPIPVILGALAALAAGTGLGVFKQKEAEKSRAQEYGQKVFLDELLAGKSVPDSILTQYFPKDIMPSLKMMGEARRFERENRFNAGMKMVGGGGGAEAPTDAAPQTGAPTPAWMPPMLQQGAGAPAGPTSIVPSMLSPVRAEPGVSFKVDEGLTLNKPATSAADVARLGFEGQRVGMESERLGMERAKQPGEMTLQGQKIEEGALKIGETKTKAKLAEREDAARAEAAGFLQQAAETPDLRGKLALFEKAYAVGVKGNLKDAEHINSRIKELEGRISGKTLDLKDPNTAEYIATTGKNPQTNEPVDSAMQRQASAFVKAQTYRKLDQARQQAQTLAAITSAEAPKRMAIGGAIKTLVKEGENVAKVKTASDQIEEALAFIEKNIDVFPKTPVGSLTAWLAAQAQTERGQRAKAVEQRFNVLQSLEARRIAGEQGRIANQIEQQWRKTIGSTVGTTQDTMRQIIKSSRELKNAMIKGNASVVTKNASAARGVGVPDNIIKSFSQGNLDVLRSTFGEGLSTGAIPPTLDMGDFDLNAAKQVK